MATTQAPSQVAIALARSGRAPAARRGVTLVELLIVITVMLMITAITIPAVAPALGTRRLRETARALDVYINGARNRAAQTGRSAGVMFERAAGLPESCSLVSMVEVPPPYSGDFVNSTVQIDNYGRIVGFPNSDIGWFGLLRQGDLIKLNHQGFQYRLFCGEPFYDLNGDGVYTTGEPYTDSVYDGGDYFVPNDLNYDKNNSGSYEPGDYFDNITTGAYQTSSTALDAQGFFQAPAPDPSTNPNVIWTLGYNDETAQGLGYPVLPPPGVYPFRVYRQPVKSAAAPLELPESIVIDLSWSGTLPTGATGLNTFGPASTADATPVIITFSPNGAVDQLFQSSLSGNLIGRRPLDPISLLVGKTVLTPNDPSMIGADGAWGQSGVDDDSNVGVMFNGVAGGVDDYFEAGAAGSDDLGPAYNLQEPTNLWVTINPKTGLVATTENGSFNPTATTMQKIYYARQSALDAQTMGGR